MASGLWDAGIPPGGSIGRTVSESSPWWLNPPSPRDGCPDVVVIVLDDVGFSQVGCYGSPITTPAIDGLASHGVRLSSFHVTPLCSPTRASLLTGANNHAVGMGTVANWDTGFPGYRGRLRAEAPTMASHLRAAGFNTFAVGKWHLTPPEAMTSVGPYSEWPLGRGFDRFYGFLGAWTSQFNPELWYDNHRIEPPSDPTYHLSSDLTDRAIQFIRDHVTASPRKPYFLYLAYGACHAPFHAPAEIISRYRGRFDDGWDRYREEVYERQKREGIIPGNTMLAPSNPDVRLWSSLSDTERLVAARWQEVFAAFLDHTDTQIGRLLDFLRAVGRFSNTLFLVLSDNGASAEGGPSGVTNYLSRLSDRDETVEDASKRLDELGGPKTLGIYPSGWAQAGNTPLRYYKAHTYGGGVRTPLIVHWDRGLRERGVIRQDFHYVTDILPTVLEATGVEVADPRHHDFIHGQSLMPTLVGDRNRPRRRHQYFEMFGQRGLWSGGWKAVTLHRPTASFSEEHWALYELDSDFSECVDLSGSEGARLKSMIELWWADAGKYQVLPLDDRTKDRSLVSPDTALRNQREWVLYPGMAMLPDEASPNTIDRSYLINGEISRVAGDQGGVLLSRGTGFGGFAFYIVDNQLVYEENVAGERTVLSSTRPVPIGDCHVSVRFNRTGHLKGRASLLIDNEPAGEFDFLATMPDLISTFGGLRCGSDVPVSVSDAYTGPNPFAGELHRVTVSLDGSADQEGARGNATRLEEPVAACTKAREMSSRAHPPGTARVRHATQAARSSGVARPVRAPARGRQ